MSPLIYKNLKEIADPKHTAVVVWDVQNALVNAAHNKDEFLKNLAAFLKSVRANNVPVIYTKITPLPMEFMNSWELFIAMKRFGVSTVEELPDLVKKRGIPESEINAAVAPQGNEIVLNKHSTSIFIGTHFEYLMRNRGIGTIIFTGISAEIGIDSCARDSGNRGFWTIVATDCVSSRSLENQQATYKTLEKMALLLPSADIMKEWK